MKTRQSDCRVCSNPKSTATQRFRCRQKGCTVQPTPPGRKPASKKERTAAKAQANKRYRATEKGAKAQLRARRKAALSSRPAHTRTGESTPPPTPSRLLEPFEAASEESPRQRRNSLPPGLQRPPKFLPDGHSERPEPFEEKKRPIFNPKPRFIGNAPCVRCYYEDIGCLWTKAEDSSKFIPLPHGSSCPRRGEPFSPKNVMEPDFIDEERILD